MKRQFMKSLKALCTGVMTLCVASMSLTSCYDDSALNAELDELGDKVTALDARLQAVEALTAKLEALTARVDALYTLKFQVTATNELQYSFDGGTTWLSTGIKLAKELECTCVDVALVDNGDSVTITVGEQSFTIEKPEEIVFEIRAGKVYFESEGTMTVAVKTVGVEDLTVMAAPKGWYAEINSEGKIEITAPNYEDCKEGYGYDENDEYYEIPAKCAASGYVKVHACGVDGKCMVGKLPVEVAGQPLIVKAYAGNAYFILAGTAKWYNATFYYGVSEKANLEADTADLLKRMNDGDYSLSDDYPSNYGELTEVEVPVAELLGEEPQVGKEYVVWAAVENSEAMPYDVEDLVLVYYSPVKVDITENEAARNAFNVEVTVDVQGVESYVAVAMPESQLEYTSVDEIKEQMAMAMAEGMYYGKLYAESYTGSALDIAAGTSYSMTGNYSPDSDVYVFILPVDGRSKEDYTPADVVDAKFSTSPLTSGGSVDLNASQVTKYMGEVYDYDIWDYVTKEIVLDPYTQLGVEAKLSSDGEWSALYYNWLTAEQYAECGTDEAVVNYLLENSYANLPDEVKGWPLYIVEEVSPATTMHFVGFVVDKAGKYGKIAHLELTTQELKKADLVWVEQPLTNLQEGALKNSKTLQFTPAFEDGKEAASYKYVLAQTEYYNPYEGKTGEQMAEELYFSTSAKTVSAEELANGVLYVEDHEYGSPYYFAIVPIDAEGNPAEYAYIMEYECVFVMDNVVTEGAEFEATAPQIKVNFPAEWDFYPDNGWGDASYYGYAYSEYDEKNQFYYEINFDVTPAAGTEVCAVLVDAKNYDLTLAANVKAGNAWAGSYGSWATITTTEPTSSSHKYYNHYEDKSAPNVVLVVSWVDAEGAYYYKEYALQEQFQYYADLMKEYIAGTKTAPVLLTPAGKQWAFNWTVLGAQFGVENMPACVDLGVSTSDYFMTGINYAAIDPTAPAGLWMAYVEGYYEVEPTTVNSGKIWLLQPDFVTGELSRSMFIEYSNLTSTTCTFNCPNLMLENIETELMTEAVTVTSQAIAM